MSTTTDLGGADKHRDNHQNEHQQHLPPTPEPVTGTPGHDGPTTASVASPPASPTVSLRASDGERAEVVERLHQALGSGCLDLAETDERVAAAYAARPYAGRPGELSDPPGTIHARPRSTA